MTVPACAPPAAASLRAALRRLPDAPSVVEAAAHLSTPITAAVGPDVLVEPGRVRYRGVVADVSGGDPVAAVAELARRAHRPGDLYVDLGLEPAAWVKVLRSGVRRLAFGTDVLFGMPVASLEGDVPASAAHAWAGLCSGGGRPGLPLVLPGGVMVDGNSARVVLRGVGGAAPSGVKGASMSWGTSMGVLDERAAAIAGRVLADFGGVAVTCRADGSPFPGTRRFACVVRLDSVWEAEVPVTVSASAEHVGARPGEARVCDVVRPELPEPFSVLGPRAADGALVVRHDPTGVVAVVRNVSDHR